MLNSYKYALMPTRLDAQGVMMCEMAVYGIPTIVSDIAVCHEMLDSYPNVLFIDNNRFDCRLNDIPEPLVSPDFFFFCRKYNTQGDRINSKIFVNEYTSY